MHKLRKGKDWVSEFVIVMNFGVARASADTLTFCFVPGLPVYMNKVMVTHACSLGTRLPGSEIIIPYVHM